MHIYTYTHIHVYTYKHIAMHKYHFVALGVEPKRIKLAGAEAELAIVMVKLSEAQATLVREKDKT